MTHDSVSRFWDNFIEKTTAYHVKPTTARWYVKHAEAYIRAQAGKRLAEHIADDVTKYLEEKDRNETV